MAQMDEDKVRDLLRRYEDGCSARDLEVLYGLSQSTVSRIITGRIWKGVTGGVNRSRAGEETDSRMEYVSARIDQGCTNKSLIAEELGITRQSVEKLIKRAAARRSALNEGQ